VIVAKRTVVQVIAHLWRTMLEGMAMRALAFKWIRIVFRCWQDRVAYDETRYFTVLAKRGLHLTSAFVAVAASAAIMVFLLMNLSATAQRTEMGKWLNTGGHDERTQKLVSLGIRRNEADLAPYDKDFVWRRIRSESQREVAVLFLPCGGMFSASIHVVENRNGRWHVTDSAGFDCHYDESVSFEVAALRNPNSDDVLGA
jgi:hypothetical protein